MNAVAIEIFDANTHERAWPKTAGDVQKIVDSYEPALSPMKFTLDHDRSFLLPGTCEKLERRGSKLVAWCKGLPDFVRGICRKGICTGRSIEVFNTDNRIKPGSPYLDGISFLVSKTPASKGLAPAEFATEQGEIFFFSEDIAPQFAQEDPGMGMTPEEMKAMMTENADLKAEVADLKGKLAKFGHKFAEEDSNVKKTEEKPVVAASAADPEKFSALEALVKTLQTDNAKIKADSRKTLVASRLADLQRTGRSVPARAEADQVYLFAEGADDAEVDRRWAEAQKWPPVVAMGRDSHLQGTPPESFAADEKQADELGAATAAAGVKTSYKPKKA